MATEESGPAEEEPGEIQIAEDLSPNRRKSSVKSCEFKSSNGTSSPCAGDGNQALIADYLNKRPEFIREWFLKHGTESLVKEWLEAKELKSSDVLNKSHEKCPIISVDNAGEDFKTTEDDTSAHTSSACLEDDDMENDLLSAHYAQMTRTGRNSVTSELFRDMISRHQNSCASTRSYLGSIVVCKNQESSTDPGNETEASSDAQTHQPRRTSSGSTGSIRSSSSARKKHLEELNEADLLMELIRDIANELDIDRLCHKILVNVGLLTHSDRSSLFLAKGSRGRRYLVAKLFDVTPDSELEEAVCRARSGGNSDGTSNGSQNLSNCIPPIPFGVGIAGHVALTKETVNIKDAYQDSRFNKEIDCRTGYRTVSLMCLPILNCRGDVIGVAQCINKVNGGNQFTEQDAKVFRKYLTFCGIGIQNAQLFEMSVQEYKRNQLLLTLAQSIFVESCSLERLVTKIMSDFQALLQCKSCRVFLVDSEIKDSAVTDAFYQSQAQAQKEETTAGKFPAVGKPRKFSKADDVIFGTVFELGRKEEKIRRLSKSDLTALTSTHIGYARHVAATGQTYNWLRQDEERKKGTKNSTNSTITHSSSNVLSLPIFNSDGRVIGVAQLVDKNNGEAFTELDVSTFEAFSLLCGLGIHNTQMYEGAMKLMAKQRVALEVLSYHASSSIEEMQRLALSKIPSVEKFQLKSFQFSDLGLSDEETCQATIRMFKELDLIAKFHIQYEVLCRWILSVKKNYRPVIYHNWRHAFNVTQTMYSMLTTGNMGDLFSDMEILAILVACLCHDLDHRGTNNSFQTKIDSPLATLYSTSTMEHHHFDQCIMILNSEGNNIFQSFSPGEYKSVIKIIESSILSTDLALYFQKKDNFLALTETKEPDWADKKSKELLRGMMMTACDVSAISKPWNVQKHVAQLVASEFFEQGDLEKSQLKQKPIAMMDREKKAELPKMQIDFIDCICLPVYKILSKFWPALTPLYEGCLANRQHWVTLNEEAELHVNGSPVDLKELDSPQVIKTAKGSKKRANRVWRPNKLCTTRAFGGMFRSRFCQLL